MSVQSKARGVTDNSVRPYVLPWLSAPVVLSVGQLAHLSLVQGEPSWTAGVSAAVLVLLFVVLSAIVWGYARPRGHVVLVHSLGTVSVHGVLLLVLVLFGVHWGLFWLTLSVLSMSALSWNVRRYGAIRGEGKDTDNVTDNTFGLSVKKVKVIEATPERAKAKWTLGKGQTLEDVRPKLGNIGSELKTVRNGMRVSAGEREGEVTVTAIFKDVLKGTHPWTGPTHPGGSVAAGFRIGMYEDVEFFTIYPVGDYSKNIAPGHIGVQGMSRSGKGACAHCLLAELVTRRDAARILLADTRKAQQFTGPIEPMIGYYADTDAKVKALVRAVETSMTERNRALGAAGFSSWEPKAYDTLGIPALFVLFQEAAAYMDVVSTLVVELAEATLSAGIFLVMESQLWKHDRMPTSLRSSVANVLCFGCMEAADANYLLSDSTIANGGNPGEWKTKHPGRFLAEVNGVEEERFPINIKGLFVPRDVLTAHVSQWASQMAPYHAIDLKAFAGKLEPHVPAVQDPALTKMHAALERVQTLPAVPVAADEEDEYDDPELEKEVHDVPKLDDPELAAIADTLDPRDGLPEGSTPDVDLSFPSEPGKPELTKAQKETLFGQMLARLADARPDCPEYTNTELTDAWVELVGEAEAAKAWQFYQLIGAWEQHGQVERVKQGLYRLSNIVTVGEPRETHAE